MIPFASLVLLHTIALEPARWLPRRVSQSLAELLPRIAAAGFRAIEVFEPHLAQEEQWPEIRRILGEQGIAPVVLSSYADLNPARTTEEEVDGAIGRIRAAVAFFGFKKVRVFPGSGMTPEDAEGVAIFTRRLTRLAGALPEVEVLLETHDHSLADDPALVVRIVEEAAQPNLGLLYQPTLFTPQEAYDQFELQKGLIRHIHLQNRNPDLTFAPLSRGITPWQKILTLADASVSATLEFVPSAICSMEKFSLEAALAEAQSEVAWVAGLK